MLQLSRAYCFIWFPITIEKLSLKLCSNKSLHFLVLPSIFSQNPFGFASPVHFPLSALCFCLIKKLFTLCCPSPFPLCHHNACRHIAGIFWNPLPRHTTLSLPACLHHSQHPWVQLHLGSALHAAHFELPFLGYFDLLFFIVVTFYDSAASDSVSDSDSISDSALRVFLSLLRYSQILPLYAAASQFSVFGRILLYFIIYCSS